MGVKIGSTSSYLYLDSWIMATIVHLATIDFCKKFVTFKEDPGGRQFDQMTQAARSIPANIAEGSLRHQTSTETEMKLLDVARASISEISYDMLCQILNRGLAPWSNTDPNWIAIHQVKLDPPHYTSDLMHDVGVHILKQKAKFDKWLLSEDLATRANAIILICGRLIRILRRQIEARHEEFVVKGGFTENHTKDRMEARVKKSAEENAPKCPICGKTMIKRTAKKGKNSGNRFWGCPDYPNCTGTIRIDSQISESRVRFNPI